MHEGDEGVVDEDLEPLAGRVLADKYRVIELVARGGMGVIYKAEQLPLGRTVALKILSTRYQTMEDPGFEKRFFLEAAALSRLKHPNTITVFDYGHLADLNTYYMVMEYVDGVPLSRELRRHGSFTPRRALHFAYEIARSLAEAHETGLVHRDLKPSNVMVVRSDEGEGVKVLDFGIVKVLGNDGFDIDTITRDDRIVGSPRYMAPEQIRNQPVDARTDIYSLGVMLYEMLTGVAPFRGKSPVATLMGHVGEPVPPLAFHAKQPIPALTERLVMTCLNKKPSQRYQGADELKQAIRRAMDELADEEPTSPWLKTPLETARVEPIEHETTTMVPLVPEQGTGRRWLLFAFVLLFGLLLVGTAAATLAWIATHRAPTPAPPTLPGFVQEDPEPLPEPIPQPPPEPVVAAPPMLTLTTDPPGATVTEDGAVLGLTPHRVAMPDGLGERTFELSLTGYEPARVTRGALTEDETVNTPLTGKPRPRPVEPDPGTEDTDLRMER